MNRYELLKLNESLLSILASNGISPKEVHNIVIYEKYKEMLAVGHKVSYIVVHLSGLYGLKERAIYTLIKRFESAVYI